MLVQSEWREGLQRADEKPNLQLSLQDISCNRPPSGLTTSASLPKGWCFFSRPSSPVSVMNEPITAQRLGSI